jgi:hypothetical protein
VRKAKRRAEREKMLRAERRDEEKQAQILDRAIRDIEG